MYGELHGTSTARVATDRPARYAKQLVSHFGNHNDGHWSDDDARGDLSFVGEGEASENPKKAFEGKVHVSFVAAEQTLLIHIEGPERLIERFEQVVGKHLVRFGAKDGLHVQWRRSNGEAGTSQ
ncbi:DUF2218 domain-containing protein [Corynebacterium sp. H128]|uniref:DUF2218 domain-containing protein n=1 Tax=unclassified Corynebacterium TaxID=2624378 RepID=UPI0030A92FCF